MGCMVSRLAAKFAFFPPSPATYQVKKRDDGRLVALSSSMPIPLADDGSLDVLLIDTKRGNKIVAFYLRNPYARLTLLYSHGNAADLGQLYDLFAQLKVNLKVNLMGYDYSGYGASTGKPSESNTYADIEAVYECLETEYGVSQEDLILYGQSVGSGPTLHLAAQLPRLRGVVLHSAILSGLRVLCHVKFTLCFDIYKNVNKIQKVKCPVLVIHGTEDDVVNWLHGNGLWKMAREPYEPLWIKGGGHCNLEIYPDYIRHLCRFIQEMENITTAVRLKKIRESLGLHKRSNTNTTTSTAISTRRRCCKIKLRRPEFPACWRRRPSCPKCCCCCWRPKCPESLMPKCSTKCCWWPKCPESLIPKCGTPKCCWWPKCPESLIPKCGTPKCCWWPKCPESWIPKCSTPKCFFWRPKCPECSRPSCIKCFSWRCFVGECCCCGSKEKEKEKEKEEKEKEKEKQNG